MTEVVPRRPAFAWPPLPHLFAGLLLLSVANAVTARAVVTVDTVGLGPALVDGLGMSWGFWVALVLGVRLALTAPHRQPGRWDLLGAAAALVLIATPLRQVSSVVATVLAVWFIVRPDVEVRLKGAAIILLALAVNLLWSHVVMLAFAGPIEAFDSFMVGLLTGTTTHGNILNFVGRPDGVLLMATCTSVQNASMALLLWLAIARSVRPQSRLQDVWVAAGLFVTVVAINLGRLSLIVQSPAMFHWTHDGPGAGLFNLAVTLAGLGWAAWDLRREMLR